MEYESGVAKTTPAVALCSNQPVKGAIVLKRVFRAFVCGLPSIKVISPFWFAPVQKQ